MALTQRDKTELTRYVRGLLRFTKESLEMELNACEPYKKALMEADEFSKSAERALAPFQKHTPGRNHIVVVCFKNIRFLTYTFNLNFGGHLGKESTETLSSDEIEMLLLYDAKIKLISLAIDTSLSVTYQGFLDAIVDVPFIDTLSDCGKLPITPGDIQRHKKSTYIVNVLGCDDVRNLVKTQLFKTRLENAPIPRITNLTPFRYQTK